MNSGLLLDVHRKREVNKKVLKVPEIEVKVMICSRNGIHVPFEMLEYCLFASLARSSINPAQVSRLNYIFRFENHSSSVWTCCIDINF